MLFFLAGLAVGLLVLAVAVSSLRRSADRAVEERMQMQTEREQVVDFMHHMVEASARG